MPPTKPMISLSLIRGSTVVCVVSEPASDAGEIAGLLLLEVEADDVGDGRIEELVDAAEDDVGSRGGDLGDRVGHQEADGEDRVVAGVRELREVALVVRRSLGLDDLDLDAEFLLRPS